MLGSAAQSSGLRRVAALVAVLSVVALLGLSAHAHDGASTEPRSCVVCSAAHGSAAPLPTEPAVAEPTAQIPLVAPAAPVLAALSEGALPLARAPPSTKPIS